MNRQQQIAAVTYAALLRLEGWIPANHRIKSKAEVADEHAFIIEMAMSAIEGKSRGGPARELRDLSAAARRAIARNDAAGWAHAWAESIEPDAVACLARAFDYARCSDCPGSDRCRRQAPVVYSGSERRRRTRSRVEKDAVGSIKLAFWGVVRSQTPSRRSRWKDHRPPRRALPRDRPDFWYADIFRNGLLATSLRIILATNHHSWSRDHH